MFIIVDANVLIDYVNADISILTLVSKHLGPVCVASVIVDEVNQISDQDCEDAGLTVIEESVEILASAAEKRGSLSFEDHTCLLLAKNNEWVCLSNDKALHRACREEGIESMWGLRPMIELVRNGSLGKEAAIETALVIQAGNPKHITPKILEEFARKIE